MSEQGEIQIYLKADLPSGGKVEADFRGRTFSEKDRELIDSFVNSFIEFGAHLASKEQGPVLVRHLRPPL